MNKMSPFFAILFSLFLLKERANLFQYGMVLVAFGGSMLIIKPRFSAEAFPAFIGLLGGIGAGAEGLFDVCESTIQTTVSKPMALSEAIENARTLYLDAAKRLFRAVRIGQKLHV